MIEHVTSNWVVLQWYPSLNQLVSCNEMSFMTNTHNCFDNSEHGGFFWKIIKCPQMSPDITTLRIYAIHEALKTAIFYMLFNIFIIPWSHQQGCPSWKCLEQILILLARCWDLIGTPQVKPRWCLLRIFNGTNSQRLALFVVSSEFWKRVRIGTYRAITYTGFTQILSACKHLATLLYWPCTLISWQLLDASIGNI